MGEISLVAASHLRRNRASSLLVVLLLAVVVAIVLAAVAGARRTDSVVAAFVAVDRGAEGYAAFPPLGPGPAPDLAAQEASVAAIEGVERTGRLSDAFVEVSGPQIPGGHLAVQSYVGREPGGLAKMSALHLVDGRHADEGRTDEVMIDEELARDADLGVGSAVTVRAFTAEQLAAGQDRRASGLRVEAEVVGIVRRPTDLRDPQDRQLVPNDYAVHQDLYLTSAFWEAGRGTVASFTPFVGFDFADGARPRQVLAAITEATGGYAIEHGRFIELDGTYKGVDRSASLHARGLTAFAFAVGVAGLFLIGQTLGRQLVLEARDTPTLRALGMTPGRLRLAVLLRILPVTISGVVLGVLGAIVLSPLAPLPGTVARRAEVDPGVSVDVTVLVVGALLAVLFATLTGALPSLRAAAAGGREGAPIGRPTSAARLASRGLSAPATTGVRFALEPGRGATAVPVRTAIATAAVTVALIVAAVTFSASLSDTQEQARRFGVTWDVAAGAMSTVEQADALAEEVGRIPGIVAFSGMSTTAYDTTFGEIPSVMVRKEVGTVTPLITSGRAPGRGEVALGALTMEEEGLEIGDALQIEDEIAGSRSFEITGTVVLNVAGVDVSIPPGRGGLFDWSMLGLLNPEGAEFIAPTMFLVDAEPGRTAAVERGLRELFPTSTRAEPVQTARPRQPG